MQYQRIKLLERYQTAKDTFVYRFCYPPKDFTFFSGQYVILKNPLFPDPQEEHPFSLASSPDQTEYLEFCIKVYGDWTRSLTQLKSGDTLDISNPEGNLRWHEEAKNAVFLVGSVGIAPIMSFLRTIAALPNKPQTLTLLYGNRTRGTVAYKEELEDLKPFLPMLKIVHIYSELLEGEAANQDYTGFITREIVQKEVDLSLSPAFYYLGPPVFIEKMDQLLNSLAIPNDKRYKEDYSRIIPPPKT